MKKQIIRFLFCLMLLSIPLNHNIKSENSFLTAVYARPVYDEDGQFLYDEWEESDEDYEEDEDSEDSGGGGLFNLDLGKIIVDAITGWIVEGILKITDFFLDLTGSIIFPESSLNVLSSVYGNLYNLSLSIAMSLMLLMALYKGFNIYILWRDGNPEENPIEIVTRFLFAMALMLSFSELYNIAGNIVEDILNKINEILSISHSSSSLNIAGAIASFPIGVVCTIIFMIIYIVQLIKAMISTMSKGIELFILRLGFPLACVDAVNPQASSFHSYVSSFIKAFFSVIVMKLLVSLSVSIFINNFNPVGLVWSISSLIMVNKGSQLINQFIVPHQGGGGMLSSAMNQAGGSMINKGVGNMAKKIPGIGKMFGGG